MIPSISAQSPQISMKVKMAVSGQKIAMRPRTMAIAPRPSALFQVNDVGVMGASSDAVSRTSLRR